MALRESLLSGGETTQSSSSLDLISGLWQEAPFTRLPSNAPPELEPYVRDIHDPRRSYAVHRASRRHDFQALVSWSVLPRPNMSN